MAWDRTRPVPWNRLIRDWLIYVVVMLVVLGVLDRLNLGVVGGILASGPVFVALGALLAKLGYQRKTMKDLRAETEARQAERAAAARAASPGPRSRPAPTKRTGGGGGPGRKRR